MGPIIDQAISAYKDFLASQYPRHLKKYGPRKRQTWMLHVLKLLAMRYFAPVVSALKLVKVAKVVDPISYVQV